MLFAEHFYVPKGIFPIFELKRGHPFSEAKAKLRRRFELDLFKEPAKNQVLTINSDDGFVGYKSDHSD